MSAKKQFTTRQPIRFDVVDLKNGKTYIPIRTESGDMEYELRYNDRFIGFAYDESAARDRLNEYAYDYERHGDSVHEVNDAEATATASTPTAELADALPFEPSADDIAASEEWADIVDRLANLSHGELVIFLTAAKDSENATPHVIAAIDRILARLCDEDEDEDKPADVPISTLADGSTVYGRIDKWGGDNYEHCTAYVDTADGWYVSGAEHEDAGVHHRGYNIDLDALTPASFQSLKRLVNSGVVEHMFVCGELWDTNQDVPAQQPVTPKLEMFRLIDEYFGVQAHGLGGVPFADLEPTRAGGSCLGDIEQRCTLGTVDGLTVKAMYNDGRLIYATVYDEGVGLSTNGRDRMYIEDEAGGDVDYGDGFSLDRWQHITTLIERGTSQRLIALARGCQRIPGYCGPQSDNDTLYAVRQARVADEQAARLKTFALDELHQIASEKQAVAVDEMRQVLQPDADSAAYDSGYCMALLAKMMRGMSADETSIIRAFFDELFAMPRADAQAELLSVVTHWQAQQQPTPIVIEQREWPDILENEPPHTMTVYRYGQAEILIHHDATFGMRTAYDLVIRDHGMDARDVQAVLDAAVLLNDMRVQAALDVVGLPISAPSAPASPIDVMPITTKGGGETLYATRFEYGGACIWLDDDGAYDVMVNGVNHERTDIPAMLDAAALVRSAEFRKARMRIEAGVTPLPLRLMQFPKVV